MVTHYYVQESLITLNIHLHYREVCFKLYIVQRKWLDNEGA